MDDPLRIVCTRCGHAWTTTAEHHKVVRCSSCQKAHRVRRPGAPDRRTRAVRDRAAGPRQDRAVPASSPARPTSSPSSAVAVPVRPPPPAGRPATAPRRRPAPPAPPAAPARRSLPALPSLTGGPGTMPAVVRGPSYCEFCRAGDALGPAYQPFLHAQASVYTFGNPPFDLCQPHLDVAWASGWPLSLLDLLDVPPGAPGPVRRAFAAGRS